MDRKTEDMEKTAYPEPRPAGCAIPFSEVFGQFIYPLVIFDNKRTVLGLNKAAGKLLGISTRVNLPALCTDIFECDKAGHHCHLNTLFLTGEFKQSEQVTIIDAEGVPVHIHVTISPIADAEGRIIGAVEMFRKLEEIENVSREVIEQAMTDQLTGLGNRRKLYESLKIESSRAARRKQPYSVLMADIDNFKDYNDAHGHVEGDTALKFVADILSDNSRMEDTVTRFGGEEFVALLPETDAERALAHADRLRRLISEKSGAAAELKSRLRVSIGAATCRPDEKCSVTSLISSADKALYSAKRAGRDCVAHIDLIEEKE